MAAAYLYGFKYADAACEVGGVRFLLCKLGLVHGDWPTLMARFANHQNDIRATLSTYPLLPHHNLRGKGEVSLYGKTFMEGEYNTVHVEGVDCVISAMTASAVLGSMVRGPLGAREVWPDLAYIVPMNHDQAVAFEAVMPLLTATYLDTAHLRAALTRLHPANSVSHTETVLVAEHTFDALRELFLANALDATACTHLVAGRRELDFRSPTPVRVEWTDKATGLRRDMEVCYYAPAYDPVTHVCEPSRTYLQ